MTRPKNLARIILANNNLLATTQVDKRYISCIMSNMSEKINTPQPIEVFEQSIEGDPSQEYETVQFSNGYQARRYRVNGQRIHWGSQVTKLRLRDASCAVIAMSSGKRVAVGAGMMAALPPLNSQTGRFGNGSGIKTIAVSEMAPNGLSDIVIGEPWPMMTEGDGTVESVMMQPPYIPHYTSVKPEQIEMPSHLEPLGQLMRKEAVHFFNEEHASRLGPEGKRVRIQPVPPSAGPSYHDTPSQPTTL